MRFLYLQFLLSFICYAENQPIVSYVEQLKKPKTNDLFEIGETFLKPFPADLISASNLSPFAADYQEARRLFESGEFDKAQTLLAKIPSKDPYGFQGQYILGAIQSQKNQFSKAASIFEGISKQDMGAIASKALGFLAAARAQYPKALSIFQKISDAEYEQAEIYEALQKYPEAKQTLEKLDLQLSSNPNHWIEIQPEMQELTDTQKRLEQDLTDLNTAESNYKSLLQILVDHLKTFQQQLEQLLQPELEIPLDPKAVSSITVELDGKTVYSSSDIKTNSMISVSVPFGQHKLSVNQKKFWLNVSLDSKTEVQFNFMNADMPNPPQPDLIYVDKVKELLAQAENLKERLAKHSEPAFLTAQKQIQNQIQQTALSKQTELKTLESALQEKRALIAVKLQLLSDHENSNLNP